MTEEVSSLRLNPLLDRLRIPGATFRLPSQALFYPAGVLDENVKNGEVEVYPMTAIDEIILSTPDKLLSGKAIIEVFSHTIPQVLKPEQLLSKDVDFLMVCLRNVSFGGQMVVTYEHDCENSKNHEYTVDLDDMIRRAKTVDPTTINTEYTVTVGNGQVVKLNPMTFADVVDLYQTTALIKTDNLTEQEAEKMVIDTLTSAIGFVDEISDREFIRQWITKIPLGWKRKLERAAQDVSQWGVDFSFFPVCKDCGEKLIVQVSANPVNFFT